MPGLLQTPSGNLRTWKVIYALLAELVGTLIFSLYGSATTLSGTTNSSLNNAIGNGLTLTVVVIITASVSGAHINPAVTLATILTGHISILKGILYILCQIAGSIIGSLLMAALLHPGVTIGSDTLPSGCFAKTDVSSGQLFGWEMIMTFVLVMTVYAVAIGEPSYGNAAPFGVGLALLVSVQAAGKFTGGALNPARALGPSIVFVCYWKTTWVYVLAELAGGAVAGLASFPLYGVGPDFMAWSNHSKEARPLHSPEQEKHKSSQEDVGIAAVFQPAEQTVPGHV